ncbi:MAG: hypothetical protein MJZ20_14020 [Bacteroidaceae bacterium]|nr:hypothetical protein [Bacteroidaceae bacterium]
MDTNSEDKTPKTQETWAMRVDKILTEAGCPEGHKTGSCIRPVKKR